MYNCVCHLLVSCFRLSLTSSHLICSPFTTLCSMSTHVLRFSTGVECPFQKHYRRPFNKTKSRLNKSNSPGILTSLLLPVSIREERNPRPLTACLCCVMGYYLECLFVSEGPANNVLRTKRLKVNSSGALILPILNIIFWSSWLGQRNIFSDSEGI